MSTVLSAPVIIAFGIALGGVIASFAAAVVLIINAIHGVAVTASSVAVTAGKIEAHVNSEKTASIAREGQLQSENAMLREIIAEKKATAMLLAQSVAVATKPAEER